MSRIRSKGTNNTFTSEFARSSIFTKITNDHKIYAFYFDSINFSNLKHLSLMLTYFVMRKNAILNLQFIRSPVCNTNVHLAISLSVSDSVQAA